MSDYLSLLAARLSGAAPTVQPRLPSRFEPPARPLNLEGALPGPVEEQVEEPAPTPISLPVQPAHDQPAAPAPLVVQIPLAQKPERSPSQVEPASQPAPRSLPGPAAPGVTVQPAAEFPTVPPRLTPLLAPVLAAHAAEKIEALPVRPVSGPTEAPAPITRQAPENRRPEATLVHQAIEVQVTRAPLSLAPLPAVSPPMVAAPPASNNPETSTGHPPTIQVTIGRIEVHAAPPPAVAGPRKSRSAPLMSLEEYLKQRNGEKR